MSALEALQATTVLLSDEPQESVDTIFFHARAWGDEDGLFLLASKIFHAKKAAAVSINGGKGGPAGGTAIGEDWPGCYSYVAMLGARRKIHSRYKTSTQHQGREQCVSGSCY